MRFLGKICFMIILKVSESRALLSLSLENIVLATPPPPPPPPLPSFSGLTFYLYYNPNL